MTRNSRNRHRWISRARVVAWFAAFAGVVIGSGLPFPGAASAAPAKINGSGSTYVSLAMQQWVADAQTDGLSINYLPTGSPQGLTSFGQSLIDFAGTEAEYSALGSAGAADQRGYQYVPDVAGAVAIMYNADDKAGRKIDYLHLSRSTVARIFMGDISKWSDPAITNDNKGLVLPDEPITVVYRGGQSGTTALFYDFVANTSPDLFSQWASRNKLPTSVRIIQLDSAPEFAPHTLALSGSDQIAQHVAGPNGKWSIAYDEFGFAKTYKAPAAWIQNASGDYVQPYAENISAALEAAKLHPDLSQDLRGVYASGNPLAYPISAYSYMVTQCETAPDRATCRGPYVNTGITETLSRWMRYIACGGQVNMARIGYSPLPPNLSQELVNSIGRMAGTDPEQLNADNCANPRFRGTLGAGASSPKDPLDGVSSIGGGGGGGTGGGGGDTGGGGATPTGGTSAGPGGNPTAGPGAAATGGGNPTAGGGTGSGPSGSGSENLSGGASLAAGSIGDSAGSTEVAAGLLDEAGNLSGGSSAEGGGATGVGARTIRTRRAEPIVYDRPTGSASTPKPLMLLIAVLGLPVVLAALRRIEGPSPRMA